MRNINILIYINRVFMGLTALLYLTIVFGLYAQVLLGIYQVLIAMFLAMNWLKLTETSRRKLGAYALVVGIYVLLWFIPGFKNNDLIWLKIAIVPMIIAVYFTYILESIRTRRRNVLSLTEAN